MGNINVMSADITTQLKSGLEETQFNFLEERKHLTSRTALPIYPSISGWNRAADVEPPEPR